MKPALLQVKNLSKYYTRIGLEKILILDSVNFSVEDREEGTIVSILAPFGSGKSTLLKILCGIEKPSEGEVLLMGKRLENPSGEVAYLPEQPSHFPWLNVRENIKLVSHFRDKKYSPETIAGIIELTGLTGYEEHIPHEKSYGFRFRISLGRALAVNPKIILLDDVFKKIDPETREELYPMLKELKNKLKLTIILASANITESLILSDQIFLMNGKPGKIISQINSENLKKISGNLKTEEITSVRKEIESAYQTENFSSSINISI